MGFFSTEQWIAVELPEVFAFFSDPNNLPRIMPAELQARVLFIDLVEPVEPHPDGVVAGTGTAITFSFRPVPFLPIRQKWVAQIVEFDFNASSASFSDRQAKGPFRSWNHRHEFEAETREGKSGTLIRDRVEFEVGYGALGRWIDRWITSRMQQTFAHRQTALESLFDS